MKNIICLILLLNFCSSRAGASEKDSIPCIFHNTGDILFLNLGRVDYPVKQGYFFPNYDKIILNNGSVISNYYRDTLGFEYYKPMNPESWDHAPTGWCSWYFYFKEITAEEVLKNVKWLAENLKDYGVDYIQIDDGWTKEIGENTEYKANDWAHSNSKFPDGMKNLAGQIKSYGFIPGLWLSPQGQTDPSLLKKWPETFIKNDSVGYDISGFWGRYLLDPSSSEAHNYLRDLFTSLDDWGFEYYKIDGQPSILEEYEKQQEWMRNPGDPISLYRNTLSTIKNTIGPGRYLLGSWGTPEEGIGIYDGARTGGDTGYNGNWYEVALRATMKYLYLNNIVWHSDPDVLLVREPIPGNQAQLWATLQAMSGQGFFLSDRMYDLSENRVNILKKTLPATPVQPVELYPQTKLKNIWDLKISHLGQDYDVLGVFNFINSDDYSKLISWESLGYDSGSLHHVFDFWEGQYLGAWRGGYSVKVQPESVKLLGIREVNYGPQLISSSRHITQGYIDLKSLEYQGNFIKGVSHVIKGDPYTLFFAFPPGLKYELKEVKCKQNHKIINHGNWTELVLYPDMTEDLYWSCEFRESTSSSFSICAQENIPSGTAINPEQVLFSWYQPPPAAGHQIYLDGQLKGFTPNNKVVLDIDDLENHRVEINTIGWNGIPNEVKKGLDFTLKGLLPDRINLTEMLTRKEYLEGPGPVDRRFFLYRKNHRLEYQNPSGCMIMGGKRYLTGLATHANSDFVYPLKSYFREFTVDIGIDDSSAKGSVIFKILCDSREVFDSGIMTRETPAKSVNIDVSNVNELRLLVQDAGDGIDGDLANWADGYLMK